ncbi:MAG: peptidase M16 [Phycisphaerae bacterium]|nr:MAG: peptidase M16 [Phycisphaerae bacterium]
MQLLRLAVVMLFTIVGCDKDGGTYIGPDDMPKTYDDSQEYQAKLAKEADKDATPRPLPQGAERHQLNNGLKFILFPTDKAKHVALDVLFDVGESHDPKGKSGLSHLVEHIYVTAAAGEEPSRTVSQYMQRYPLGSNAQTGEDYTIIATVFEKTQLENEIKDAANRMGALDPKQADLDREVPRLLQEVVNMFGGMPQLAVLNHGRNNVRPSSIGHRKGGLPEHVKLIGLNDVIHWWLDHYKPSNATIVLAGNFDAGNAKGLIEKHFGPIPAGQKPGVTDTPGPPNVGQLNVVTINSRMKGAPPHACVSFAAPLPGEKHYPAYLVLVSRMFSQFTSQGLKVMFSPIDDPMVISVFASAAGKTDEESIAGLRKSLDNVINMPLAPMETMVAKNMLGLLLGIVDYPPVMFQQNLYGVAFSIGRCEQLQVDSAKLKKAIDNLTDKDIKAAAKAVFGTKKQVAVVVKPK